MSKFWHRIEYFILRSCIYLIKKDVYQFWKLTCNEWAIPTHTDLKKQSLACWSCVPACCESQGHLPRASLLTLAPSSLSRRMCPWNPPARSPSCLQRRTLTCCSASKATFHPPPYPLLNTPLFHCHPTWLCVILGVVLSIINAQISDRLNIYHRMHGNQRSMSKNTSEQAFFGSKRRQIKPKM